MVLGKFSKILSKAASSKTAKKMMGLGGVLGAAYFVRKARKKKKKKNLSVKAAKQNMGKTYGRKK